MSDSQCVCVCRYCCCCYCVRECAIGARTKGSEKKERVARKTTEQKTKKKRKEKEKIFLSSPSECRYVLCIICGTRISRMFTVYVDVSGCIYRCRQAVRLRANAELIRLRKRKKVNETESGTCERCIESDDTRLDGNRHGGILELENYCGEQSDGFFAMSIAYCLEECANF